MKTEKPSPASPVDASRLWNEHHDSLFAFIQHKVGDIAEAKDLLQEVFLKMLLKIDTLQDQTKVRSWLYQISRNAVIDYYRNQKPHSRSEMGYWPEEALEDDRAMRHIEGCIRPMIHSLPPLYREALLLSEIEGLSQKELAGRLQISYSGAKSRVQRGRLLLKQALTDCCTFELDRYGKVLDYQPNPKPCDDC